MQSTLIQQYSLTSSFHVSFFDFEIILTKQILQPADSSVNPVFVLGKFKCLQGSCWLIFNFIKPFKLIPCWNVFICTFENTVVLLRLTALYVAHRYLSVFWEK